MQQRTSEEFLEAVKEVLENLYDFPFLNRHVLAQTTPTGQPNEPAGYRLRRELIAAIESLSPGEASGTRTNAARLYNLMHMHYVGGMTLPEVAHDLGISVRQAYRDLRHGHESVGEMLRFQRDLVEPEVERLETNLTIVNINLILEVALKAVQRFAEQQQLHLNVQRPNEPILIPTNQAASQQILIHVLSQAIQHAQPGNLDIYLMPKGRTIWFEVGYKPKMSEIIEIPLTEAVQDFIQQLRFLIAQTRSSDGQNRLQLHIPAHNSMILVIDDNQGLIDLLQRYFAGHAYKVVAATSGEEGLKLAEELQPNAIIMDLMMPGMDGWSLLQLLRTTPDTHAIPVIICSVINDPELAYSLGASLFIAKPVNKDRIFAALKEIGL